MKSAGYVPLIGAKKYRRHTLVCQDPFEYQGVYRACAIPSALSILGLTAEYLQEAE